jgi:hypothetical protein
VASGTHSEPTVGSLALRWTLEMGHPQPRWAMTKHARPYRLSWLNWASSLESGIPSTAAYRVATYGVRSLYLQFFGKLCCLVRSFL